MTRLAAYVAVFALLAGFLVAADLGTKEHSAAAAPADAVDCSPDSPYLYNLHSENGSPSGTDDPTGRSNRIERVDVRTGAKTTVADLSSGGNRLTQQLNGLGLTSDGGKFYFVSHNIDRRPGETIDSPDSLRRIYSYDNTTGTLSSVKIPWDVWDPGADHIARHGAVDPATGIYYFATSVQDADASTERFAIVAYDPKAPAGDPDNADGSPNPAYPENVWLAGTLTAPGVRGNSGDMAFDQYGNLVFLISRTDSVGSIFTLPKAQLPTTPGQSADLTLKPVAGLQPAQAGGNAVGVAFGRDGYVYISYTDGTLNRIDPSTGETVSSVARTPLGSGGGTTDLASCAAPSSLTVRKNIDHRYQSDDQFTLGAVRDSSADGPEIGEPATTSGTATGVQDASVGPVPILTTRVESDGSVTGSRDYYIAETGSGADLDDYSTTLECTDLLDSSYRPAVTPVQTSGGRREWRVTVSPRVGDAADVSEARAIQCTFTNADTASPHLTLNKSVDDPDGVAGGTPLEKPSAWTLTATGGDTLSGKSGVSGAVTAGSYALSEDGPDGYTASSAGWDCQTASGTEVPVTGGRVSLADGQDVRCSITNQPRPGSVTWSKTDHDDNRLGGSTWRLTGPDGSTTITDNEPPDTDPADGAFRVGGLPWGDYTLTETAAPDGHAIDGDSSRTFTVGPDETSVGLGAITDTPTGALAVTKAYTGDDLPNLSSIDFTGTYSCEVGDEKVASGTWSATGTGPASFTPDAGTGPADAIPEGATCTVEENTPSDSALPSDAWSWGAPVYTTGGTRSGTVVIAAGQTRTMTVTNSAARSSSAFSVVKRFTGSVPSFVADTTFTGTYACTVDGGTVASGTWSVTGLGEATLTPPAGSIDPNATCTGTENTPGSATLPDSSWHWGTPSVSFDGDDPDHLVLDVTNSASQALTTLTIHKAYDGTAPAEADGKLYSGTWSCDLDGVTRDGTWSATAGEGYGPITVRQGARCTVSETRPSGDLPAGWQWNAPSYAPGQTVDIPGSTEPSSVTVTNSARHDTGALDITKAWSGPRPDGVSDATFSGSYSCTYDGAPSASGTWTVTGTGGARLTAADGSPAPDAIPAASDCTVTETAPDQNELPDGSWSWNDPAYSPNGGTVTIPDDGTGTATVTNSATRSFGAFSIAKALGSGAPGDATYTGSYECLLGSGPTTVASGTWTVTGSGPATVTQTTGDIDRVPVSSYCRVTENPPSDSDLPDPSWEWEPPAYSSGGQDLGPGGEEIGTGTNAVTVTNAATQSFGALAVTKRYAAGVPDGTSTTFRGHYDCTLNDQTTASGSWRVTGTGDATLTPDDGTDRPDHIMAGSGCTIAEADPSGGLPGPSWHWGEPSYDPAQVTIAKDRTGTVTVTNRAEGVYGGFSVTKKVRGHADPSIEFSGRWRCHDPDGTVTGSWGPIRAGATWATPEGTPIPRGAACSVTAENTPASPGTGFAWAGPPDTGDTVHATADPADATITVVNTTHAVEPTTSPSPTAPGTPTAPGSPTAPGTPGPGSGPGIGGLPFTGASIWAPAALALALLTSGAIFLTARRRRRRERRQGSSG